MQPCRLISEVQNGAIATRNCSVKTFPLLSHSSVAVVTPQQRQKHIFFIADINSVLSRDDDVLHIVRKEILIVNTAEQ